jgi:hypothetical protein
MLVSHCVIYYHNIYIKIMCLLFVFLNILKKKTHSKCLSPSRPLSYLLGKGTYLEAMLLQHGLDEYERR